MKGRGLGLGREVRQGPEGARPKRWRIARLLFVDFDWPHGWHPSRCWKRHRRTQYRTIQML